MMGSPYRPCSYWCHPAVTPETMQGQMMLLLLLAARLAAAVRHEARSAALGVSLVVVRLCRWH